MSQMLCYCNERIEWGDTIFIIPVILHQLPGVCNIMTGLRCVGTMRHLLAHTLCEAAMKLGWNTTRM